MIIKSRSKIHPKIIFKIITKDDNVLIIGTNNSDIIEVLKHKKAKKSEINSNNSNQIIEKLQEYENDEFDFIILNLEISKLNKIKKLVSLINNKSKVGIFRVRNNNLITKKLKTKKTKLLKYFKENNINIIKKIYCRKNKICNHLLAHFVSYYVIYITNKKSKKSLNFQEVYATNFLKKLLKLTKNKEAVLTSEKN